MNIHFIQHEVFEAPGAFLDWAKARDYLVSFSKVFEYESLPKSLETIDMLIVLGGPQSPNSSVEEFPYFDAKAEIELIKNAIKLEKCVLGVCLGAQLIGEAMGAKVENSPEKEMGIFPIQLTEEGLKNNKISHFGSSLLVGHWHNDMPGLSPESKVLATSEGCPRQIIAFSEFVYGFQCHMEFTTDLVKMLITEDEEFLLSNHSYKFVQKPNEILHFNFSEMNDKLFTFLDKLVVQWKKKQGK